MNESMWKVMDVTGCARCHGEGHRNLIFKPLTHPIQLDEGDTAVYFALCPTNGEPILLCIWETL